MAKPLHLAIVQFEPKKGDYAGTLARVQTLFGNLAAQPAPIDIVVFAETAFTGYFLEGGVRDFARTAESFASELNEAHRASGARPLDVVAGFYELFENTYYNSAMYVSLGESAPVIAHVHRKVFLPTYGMFDEERFVEHGHSVRAFDTPWGRAAILICEDAWHAVSATVAALDGAQIVFVPSASPARGVWPQPDEETRGPASIHRWERLARDRAEEHGIYVAVVHLVGSEGGKTFPGGSVVAGPHGDIRARAPLWKESVVTVELDLDDITRAHASSPLLADLRTMLPHMLRSLSRAANAADDRDSKPA